MAVFAAEGAGVAWLVGRGLAAAATVLGTSILFQVLVDIGRLAFFSGSCRQKKKEWKNAIQGRWLVITGDKVNGHDQKMITDSRKMMVWAK